jgi:CRP-like cAMP-binding protein
MDKVAILSRTTLFQKLPEIELQKIAKICKIKQSSKKNILFGEGEAGSTIYLLTVGSIQLSKTSCDGKQVVINTVGAGSLFGETVLFDIEKYPVTATVLKESTLFAISKKEFQTLLLEPKFSSLFIGSLLKKMRALTQKIQCLTTCSPENRFYGFILEHYGARNEIVFNISKKEIASAIGATPETLSRLLARLSKDDGVVIEGKKVIFPKGFWDGIDLGGCSKEW